MRSVVKLALLSLVGCGDNIIPATDANIGSDSSVDSPEPDMMITPPSACDSDSVSAIQAGNPGNDPAAYPAQGWWSDDTRSNGTASRRPRALVARSPSSPPARAPRARRKTRRS